MPKRSEQKEAAKAEYIARRSKGEKKCIWYNDKLNYCPFPRCAYDRSTGGQDEQEPTDEKAKASREWMDRQVESEVRKILAGRYKNKNGGE